MRGVPNLPVGLKAKFSSAMVATRRQIDESNDDQVLKQDKTGRFIFQNRIFAAQNINRVPYIEPGSKYSEPVGSILVGWYSNARAASL
jgi:hypothetical protein